MTLDAIAQITAFAICAVIAIAGGLGMATTMSMFRSGIFLMASFIGVAGLFILLSADLLSLLQVMMYIGGMLVMILFMVLFSDDPGGSMMAGMEMAPIERLFSLGIETEGGMGQMDHDQMAMDHDQMAMDSEQPSSDQPSDDSQHHHDEADQPHAEHSHQTDAAGMSMDHSMDHSSMDHANQSEPDAAQANGEPSSHQTSHQNSSHHMNMNENHQDGEMKGEMDGDMSGMDMGGMDMGGMSMVTPIRPLATVLSTLIGVLLVALLLLRPAWQISIATPDPDSAQKVGTLLMGKYMIGFEGAGLLILTGIFGAVLLSRPGSHPSPSDRNAAVEMDAPPAAIAEEPARSQVPS